MNQPALIKLVELCWIVWHLDETTAGDLPRPADDLN
jgi:hypothetical protein